MLEKPRGGVCHSSNRYVKVNQKTRDDYDPKRPTTHLPYFDQTSQYATVMSEYLPCGVLEDAEAAEWSGERVLAMKADGEQGALVLAHLRYPPELHDRFRELPVMPYHDEDGKLVLDMSDRPHYLVHYRRLQQLLRFGVELVEIEAVWTFKQAPWLRSWVTFCQTKRAAAAAAGNVFQSKYWKLMANCVWGKLAEDVRKYSTIKLVADQKVACELDLDCVASSIVTEDEYDATTLEYTRAGVSAMQMRNKEVYLDKPILTAFAILDMAKVHWYDFYYEQVQRKWPGTRFVHGDTDSMVVEVPTEDIVADIKRDTDFHAMLDCSGFPSDHPLYNEHSVKRLGSWKEETGFSIVEVAALKRKQWAHKTASGVEEKRAAGVSKAVTKQDLRFEHYVSVIESGQASKAVVTTRVKSEGHVLSQVEVKSRLKPAV